LEFERDDWHLKETIGKRRLAKETIGKRRLAKETIRRRRLEKETIGKQWTLPTVVALVAMIIAIG
jgi:hypothetical protein